MGKMSEKTRQKIRIPCTKIHKKPEQNLNFSAAE